jgi:hypothetical protein
VRVIVRGHDPVFADASGNFTVNDVDTPYDIFTVQTGDNRAVVAYLGLTRANPRVFTIVQTPGFTAELTGTVSGGAGYPEPADTQTSLTIASPFTQSGLNLSADTATGDYTATPSWSFSATTTLELTALQFTTTGGLATAFPGAATASIAAVHGDVLVQDLFLAPVSTATVSGTYTVPAGYVLDSKVLAVESSGLTLLNLPGDSVDDGTFSLMGPVIPGRSLTLQVQANFGGQSSSIALRRGITSTVAGLSIQVPAAAQILFPLEGAVDVDVGSDFFCSPFPLGVQLFTFAPDNPEAGFQYFICTTDTHVTLPDLSEFGIAPAPGELYNLAIAGLGPFSDMDDFAGPNGPLPSPVMYLTNGAQVEVTIAP